MKRAALIALCVLAAAPCRAADSRTTKDSYVKKTQAEVDEWADKLKTLQNRSQENGAHVRDELDRKLHSAEDELSAAREKLDALRESQEGNWDRFRKEINKALTDVKHDYRKAVSFFKKNSPKEKS